MPIAGQPIGESGHVVSSGSSLRPLVDGCAVLRVDGTIEGLSEPRVMPSDCETPRRANRL